jgi:2-dehydropantoate 2-reductase
MKIAVMGTGGVGGYFGARLAAKGVEVTFIARGAHLGAIRAGGLRLESANGNAHIQPARATDTPADVGPVDYVLFATKLWDTAVAGQAIRPMIGADTAVISLQNGVFAEQLLSEIVGGEHVMGGLAQISSFIAAPGVIRHAGTMARAVFGELDGKRTPRAQALLEAFHEAGVDADIADNIERAIWQKFVFLVGLSGVTAVTRQSIGPVREDTDTRALLAQVMAETATVARAKAIDIDPAFVDDRLAFMDTLPGDMTSSMAHDLAQGNRLELDWLSGAVVHMGRELGVDTPANAFIYTTLKLSAAGSSS